MDHIDLFETHRGYLFGIAYRILGSVMEAEDILQDAFLRWRNVPLLEVEAPKAYLATIVTRLSIDQLRSARYRRELYIGPWLPEPLITSRGEGLVETPIRRETLSVAVLHLLEQLSPEQRAAFILREAFDYEYAEIADILNTSPQNSRQLVSRARRVLEHHKPQDPPVSHRDQALIKEFVKSISQGDTARLEALLAEDIVHYSDGNGAAGVARKPIKGREVVIRFYYGLQRLAPPDMETRFMELNGRPALLILLGGAPYSTLCFHIVDGRVQNTYSVVNPEKLVGLGVKF